MAPGLISGDTVRDLSYRRSTRIGLEISDWVLASLVYASHILHLDHPDIWWNRTKETNGGGGVFPAAAWNPHTLSLMQSSQQLVTYSTTSAALGGRRGSQRQRARPLDEL